MERVSFSTTAENEDVGSNPTPVIFFTLKKSNHKNFTDFSV